MLLIDDNRQMIKTKHAKMVKEKTDFVIKSETKLNRIG